MENKELIFIYNANSDFWSQAKDLVAKITKGKTPCSLCNATWAVFDKKKTWSEKEKKIKIPYRYFHKDQLEGGIKNYLEQSNINLPSVLLKEGSNYRELVNSDQLNKCDGNESCVWNLLRWEKSLLVE